MNEESEYSEQISSEGWQNIGMMMAYIGDRVDDKYISLFMKIVKDSFGYGSLKTNRITVDKLSKRYRISKPTFISKMKWLSENGYITINTHNGFVEGGGSVPNSYSPCFPKGYGKIWIKDAKASTPNKNLMDKF